MFSFVRLTVATIPPGTVAQLASGIYFGRDVPPAYIGSETA
jgi:hypothetical protein